MVMETTPTDTPTAEHVSRSGMWRDLVLGVYKLHHSTYVSKNMRDKVLRETLEAVQSFQSSASPLHTFRQLFA